MSVNKKRKSDVNVDSGGVANPKKEKWYDEEQKAKMLAAPIEPTGPGTGRRSSFLGAIGALKRMVSGSTLKDKCNSRSTTKITPAAQLTNAANAATFSSKENDSSFASVNSHESDNRVNLANSVGIRTFVLTGEIPKALPADSATSDYISNEDPFDAPTGVDNMLTDSSSSVFSMVTPSRNFRRDTVRRSSVRSMPECTNTMIESLALTGVRRHASVSASDQVGSPVSRPSRYSFRLWRSKPSSMADLPENAELNTSFAPLAEIEETNTVTPLPEKRSSNLVRTASRLFSSGNKKRTTIANPNEILSISMNADGGNEEFSTPKNPANFKIPSPSSSGLQKRVSNAFNILRFKSTPSPGRGNRVQRSKTENPKTDHRIRKKTDNPRRSTLPCGGLANSSFVDTYREDNQKEKKAMADMFRLYVSCSDTPIPEILESSEFDAIIIDVLGGKPFGTAAAEIVAFFNAAEDVQKACLLDADKMEAIFKRDGAPALVCIKGDSQMMKDVGARVRTGVGCGLREVWKEDKKNRVLAYPTFVSEEEGSDVDKCLGQFFVMVHNALGPDWGFNPDNCERIVLAGVSDDHAALMKEHFDIFVSKLPSHDT